MFRAIRDFDGSDTAKCISLTTGDALSAVHAVDETWFIGYDERTGETGAFPISYVEVEKGNEYTPLPDKRGDIPQSPEEPGYANVSLQIKEKKSLQSHLVKDMDPIQRSRTLSNQANKFETNRLLHTKPEKTFRLKVLQTDSEPEKEATVADEENKQTTEEIFAIAKADKKDNTLQKVRFDDVRLEHSLSVPESVISWQESSFEQSNDTHHDEDFFENITTPTSHAVESTSDPKKTKNDGKYHQLQKLKASTDKLFHSDKQENKTMKAVFGSLAGLVIGGLLFVVLVFSFGYNLLEAGIIVLVSTIIMSLCLAFSSLCRCIMALVFPNFFTGKGRAVFLSIIFGIMISHPITNITHNAKETGNSLGCIVELAANQTKALHQQLAQPIKDVGEYIVKQKQQLRVLSKGIDDSFGKVKYALDEIDKGVGNASKQLQTIVKQCREPITKAVNECNANCRKILLVNSVCFSACSAMFEIVKVCDELKSVDNFITTAARDTRAALDKTVKYFVVDINVDGEFSGDANSSKPLAAIKDEVNKDIAGKASTFESILTFAKKFLSLSLGLIFIQAFWYLRNYLAKDGYDNIYITKQFKKLDNESKEKGTDALLPLKKKEKDVYVDTLSWKLNSNELAYCKLGLFQVLLHFLLCLLVVLFDFTLYYILHLVKQYGEFEIDIQGQGRFKINVDGSGPVADFYRIMFVGFNVDQNYTANLEIDKCLPNPQAPSVGIIPGLLVLYIVALIFVLLRGYGMRLRRKISAYYYPEQENARLEYLHKKIRHKRVGFLKFLRQQIKSSHKENLVKDKLRLSTWFAFRFPCLACCLPESSKLECSSCEQKESSFHAIKLTKCTGESGGVPCDAVYCQECSAALNNGCPLCSQDEVVLRE